MNEKNYDDRKTDKTVKKTMTSDGNINIATVKILQFNDYLKIYITHTYLYKRI